jgi:hypothetical protein
MHLGATVFLILNLISLVFAYAVGRFRDNSCSFGCLAPQPHVKNYIRPLRMEVSAAPTMFAQLFAV